MGPMGPLAQVGDQMVCAQGAVRILGQVGDQIVCAQGAVRIFDQVYFRVFWGGSDGEHLKWARPRTKFRHPGKMREQNLTADF